MTRSKKLERFAEAVLVICARPEWDSETMSDVASAADDLELAYGPEEVKTWTVTYGAHLGLNTIEFDVEAKDKDGALEEANERFEGVRALHIHPCD